jgi:hypothetical protein
MTVASITRLTTQAIRRLNAAPADPTYYGDTPSGNSLWEVKQEIVDALLAADQELLIAIVSTPGHFMRGDYLSLSGNLLHGARLPGSLGWWGDVELNTAADGSGAWSRSNEASSRAAILEAVEFQNDGIFGTSSSDVYPWHWIEDVQIFHTGGCARCLYVNKSIGVACLCPENYESAILYGGLRGLRKVGVDPMFFDKYDSLWEKGKALAVSQARVIPPQAELERMQLSQSR